jgi:hypothetical protein
MVCARCDEPIQGEREEINVDTGTGASSPVYVCAIRCRPMPRQAYPRQR